MNRPNNNSLGLLAVISVGMFVLALVYHMLIGGRGFLAAAFFALVFAVILAALIYLFLMTPTGMEWSQTARKKIVEKTGHSSEGTDDALAPSNGETAKSSPSGSDSAGASSISEAAAESAAEEATAASVTPIAPEPEPEPQPAPVAPPETAPSEPTRVEPTRVAPSRIIEPIPAEPTPPEPTLVEPTPEEPPRVEPTRVQTKRIDPISAGAKTSMTEDYDGDGVLEGTNEGAKPAGLDAPRGGEADDLKMIKGVGPKLEKICNSLGFWHFDQVAAWSDDEAAWVDANLQGFKGRVSRDRWIEQAKTLAGGRETEFSKRVEGGDVY